MIVAVAGGCIGGMWTVLSTLASHAHPLDPMCLLFFFHVGEVVFIIPVVLCTATSSAVPNPCRRYFARCAVSTVSRLRGRAGLAYASQWATFAILQRETACHGRQPTASDVQPAARA